MRKGLQLLTLIAMLTGPAIAQGQIRPFVTTWTTTEEPETISIPLNGNLDYDFTYVWKNAADSSEVISGTHTSADGTFSTELPTAGNYLLEITGSFPHLRRGYPVAVLTDVNQWGDIVWENFNETFRGWPGTTFSAKDTPNLSSVTTTFRMFFDARNINFDASDWDVSNVENMGDMFRGARAFNSDISNWDVSNATNLAQMFAGARVFTSDLSGWQLNDNVTNLSGMFRDAREFNSDLNSWNVSNVTNMSEMFRQARNFNSNLNNWDVSKVTNMNRMFEEARAFNGDISTWVVERVTNMGNMFRFTNVFNSDISGWNVSSVTSMAGMFQGAVVFNRDISRWNVGNVTNLSIMFAEARVFNQDISEWNVSNVTNMFRMFRNANRFNQDISAWEVTSVEGMNEMFLNATDFDQNLGEWDISSVTSMTSMFSNSGLSPQNYDQTLIGWAPKVDDTTPDVTLGASGLTFCKAEAARQSLLDNGWTINDSGNKVCSDETDFISFKISDVQLGEEVIDAVNHTVALSILSSADITSLTPVVDISAGATAVPDPATVQDFTSPVLFTITAEDEVATQEWTVTVTQEVVALTETDIVSFNLAEDSPGFDQVSAITLDEVAHTVTLDLVPFGSLTTIISEITLSQGATSNLPADGSLDLTTGSATITVTAEDGITTQDWTISTNVLPSEETDIIAFEVASQIGVSEIDSDNHAITFTYPSSLDATALAPVITVSDGATIDPASGASQDFTNPVLYTVTAQDGSTTQEWTVSLIPASSETDILSFRIPFGTPGIEQVNDVEIENGLHLVTINLKPFTSLTSIFPAIELSEGATITPESDEEVDISSGSLVYTVTAEDGVTTQEWTVNTNVLPSEETDIIAMTIPGQIGESDINALTHEISIIYPFATGITDLTPEIEVSPEASVDPLSGVARDFSVSGTNSVEYTVTAQDGVTTQVWTVTLVPASTETDILAFDPDEDEVDNVEIDSDTHTVTLSLVPFSSLASIFPEIELSDGATISPDGGEEVDISSGSATYVVTAEDGVTTQDWTVNTNVLPSEETDFVSFTLPGQTGGSFIDPENHSIVVFFAQETELTSTAPVFELSREATSSPASGEAQDFSSDVTYTVTAQDGITTQEWTVSAVVQRPFITSWSSTGGSLIIGLNGDFDYNFNYIWKNSSGQVISFGQHTSDDGEFSTSLSEGEFTLEILGIFPHFTGYPEDQLLDVNQWGDIIWLSFDQSFRFWTGVDFSATDTPDLSQGPDMFRAFSDNPNFNADLSDWDMSQVTRLQGLFNTCPSFNSDISGWDVGNVTNMESTFNSSGFNGDLSQWDVSNVINMRRMFLNVSEFDQDLSNWVMTSMENMDETFEGSGLSVQNYDRFLISIAAQDVQEDVTLGATGLNRCLGTAAKEQLEEINGWTIDDDGELCSSENDITAFSIADIQIGEEVIDVANHTITLQVLASADLVSLTPSISLSDGASVAPDSGEAVDFSQSETTPVVYSVVSSDSTVQEWSITLTRDAFQTENDILTFDPQSNEIEEVTIDSENHEITLKLISGGSITTITPELTISQGASVAPANGESIDLSSGSATYTVTAEDGTTIQDWTITVILNDNTDILDFELTGTFSSVQIDEETNTIDIVTVDGTDLSSLLAEITIPDGSSISPPAISIQDFTSPVTYTVTAEDGVTTQDWVVSVGTVRPFITVWSSNEDNEQFIGLEINGDFNYDFAYRWSDEDGVVVETGVYNLDEEFFMELPEEGNFTLEIIGDFPHFSSPEIFDLIDVLQWGDIQWRSFRESFGSWQGVKFSATDAPDLSLVTDMSRMFLQADAFNGDLSSWVTSNVTDMSFMFAGADAFNGDVSSWDVSNVTNMNRLFNLATAFNRDLSEWDVTQVTDMFRMFRNSSFNQDISGWNVSNVIDMGEMFNGSDLSTQFYDRLLIAWSAQEVQSDVVLGASGIGHCFGASAITTLENDNGWTINDAGALCSAENDILAVTIPEAQIGEEIIDDVAHTVEVTVFSSADLTALSPEFTLSDQAIFSETSPQSGQPTDFTSPVTYEVLSSDSTFQSWTVTVSNSATLLDGTDILTFDTGEENAVNIDAETHEITFDALLDADFRISPEITISTAASISPASGEEIDLSDGTETYTVTAEDGTIQEWTVIANDLRPANDLCTNAITINVGDVVVGSTTNATSDANIAPDCGSNFSGLGVWYRITGNGETITLNTCSPNSFGDTSLSVFTGSCNEGLSCLAGNEDAEIIGECGPNGFQASLKFNTVVDQEYLILVDGFDTIIGEFEMTVSSAPTPEAPANDDCETAEALTVFPANEGSSTNGDNVNATSFDGIVECDFFANINDVWYTFNSGDSRVFDIVLELTDTDEAGELSAAEFIKMDIYDGCGGRSLLCDGEDGDLFEVDQQQTRDTLRFFAEPDTDYKIQLWNSFTTEGSFTIQVNEGPNTPATLSFDDLVDNTIEISRFPDQGLVLDEIIASDEEGDEQLFSIIAGNEEGIFAINSLSGQITIADVAALNNTTTNEFTLVFQAADQGSGGITSEITLTVTVTENGAPVIGNTSFEMAENLTTGTVIGNLNISDPNGDLTTITGFTSTPPGAFSLDLISGEVSVGDPSFFDFEIGTDLSLDVEVRETASSGLVTAETIEITLTDVNEAPVVDDASFTISQFNGNGSVVGTVTFTEEDANQTHSYAITEGNQEAIFTIDPSTGVITVVDESVLNTNGITTYDLTVQVLDNGTPVLSGTGEVVIEVVGNNPPVFETVALEVDENSANSTLVGTITATDADGDAISFAIESGEFENAFLLTADGQLFVSDGSLLDFETNPTVELTVSATDNGPDQLKTEETFTIQVNNINEPLQLSNRNFDISTVIESGTIIGSMEVEDPDSEVFTFAITAGNEEGVFEINENSGELSLVDRDLLNPVNTPRYTLTISASDGEFTDEAQVTIDVFANPDFPVFTSSNTFTIDENNESEAVLGIVVATDADGISDYDIISGDDEGLFFIDSFGELRADFGVTFDFEEVQQFTLEIRAEDDGIGNLNSTQEITININDVNEFDPVIASSEGSTIPENSSEGTEVGSVLATDEDIFQTLSYAITAGNTGEAFVIDNEGTITVNDPEPLDFETNPSFTLTVQVSDDVDPVRSASVEVVIELSDVNELTDILAFELDEQTGPAVINATDHTVEIEVAFGTDLTALVPTFTLSDRAVSNPASGSAIDFTNPATITVTAEDGVTTQEWTISVNVAQNTATDILAFELEEQTGTATINATDHTVTIEVEFGADLTVLEPTFTLSEGAVSNPVSGSTIDFTNPATVTVTAEDGVSTQEWIVTVTEDGEEPDTGTDILTFVLAEQTVDAIINSVEHTIQLEVAFGTDVSALTPDFILSEGATSNPATGSAIDFTNPVIITVTAEDEITVQDWVVNVEIAPNTATDILTFSLTEQTGAAVISTADHTITIEVAFGTDFTALAPTFTLSEGATSDPDSRAVIDFTNPVVLTVTAEDGVTIQEWIVTVTEDGEEPDIDTDILTFSLAEQTTDAVINTINHTVEVEVENGTDVTTLIPAFTLSEGATSDPVSGTMIDFTDPVTITVTAEDVITVQDWVITVIVAGEPLSSETDILTFVLAEQTGIAAINTADHTVEVEVGAGTSLTSLSPTITLSAGASSSPASGASVNFTNAVTYTVTAEDGTTQDWLVTVTIEPLSVERAVSLEVYPNPVSDILHVRTEGNPTVYLTDLGGRRVVEAKKGADLEFNLTGLSSGLYLLIVQYEDQNQNIHKTLKVVVN